MGVLTLDGDGGAPRFDTEYEKFSAVSLQCGMSSGSTREGAGSLGPMWSTVKKVLVVLQSGVAHPGNCLTAIGQNQS